MCKLRYIKYSVNVINFRILNKTLKCKCTIKTRVSKHLPVVHRSMGQRPLAPSVSSVTSVANDKGDNEMIPGAVHRSPGICLMAEENPRKPQLGDRLMKGPCNQSSPQMRSLSSK